MRCRDLWIVLLGIITPIIGYASFLSIGGLLPTGQSEVCQEQRAVGYSNYTSFAFGNQSTGTTKVLTGTYTNIGRGYISAVHASMSSATGGFRLYSSTCVNATLTANQSCNYKTAFTPVAAGAVSNAVYIDSDQLDSVRVSVSGTGTGSVEPDAGTVLFGSSTEGATELAMATNSQYGFTTDYTASWATSATNTTVGSVEVFSRGNATGNCKAIITDSSGVIISNGVSNPLSISYSATKTWKSFTMGTPPTVTKNTNYRLAIVCNASNIIGYTNTGTGAFVYVTGSYTTPINMQPPTGTQDSSSTASSMRAKK